MAETVTIIIRVPKPRDPIARDLHTPKYHQRVIKPKKGKGAFKRKDKNDRETSSNSGEDR